MTFSIVAHCEESGQLGVGAVTGMPGVGTLLTWAQPRVGAVATQGWINPYLAIDALAMLGTGHSAAKSLQAVIALDDDRDLRQVGVVDAHGRSAAWTGSGCELVSGDLQGEGFTVQGNLLESAATLQSCAETFAASAGEELVERLIRALEAGEEAGGDKRGACSATVLVVATEHYPLWDIRVDHADQPLDELRRMRGLFAEHLLPHVLSLPTRDNLSGQLAADQPIGLV